MANLDLYNQLKEMFEGIRDERGMHSNTATRIGNAFLSLLSYAETGLNFLRKDQDDRTPHNLSVGGRLTAETELQLGEKFISGAAGGRLDGDGNGELLSLIVRSLLTSPDFRQGFTGEGWRLWLENGLSKLEIDELTVRQIMTVFELIINKIRSVGGQIVVSAANGKVKSVSDTGDAYRIFFDGDNYFQPGDLIRCQTFTGNSIHGYWVEADKAYQDSVIVSKSEFAEGMRPQDGDEVVLMGSTVNTLRQNLIVISAAEDGQPRIDVLDGVCRKSFEGCLRARFGNLDGIQDPWFPSDNQPHGNGLYADNAYLRGTFLLTTGEDIKTKFEVMEGKITSTIESVRQDFMQDKGFLNNPRFVEGFRHWTAQPDTVFFLFGQRWIWANGSALSRKGDGASVMMDDGRHVVRIRNSYIMQKSADFRSMPEIKTGSDGRKEPAAVYLSFFYKVRRSGTLTIGFENVSNDGFVDYEPFSYSADLDTTASYRQLNASGLWNGTGDFKISFTGDIHIYMLVLGTDRVGSLQATYRTLFEQTDRLVKISAAVFDKDAVALRETGLAIKPEGAGIYVQDADGNIGLIGICVEETAPDGGRRTVIKLSANDIRLEGLVTANGYFKILEDGSTESVNGKFSGEINAKAGNIGGFAISDGHIGGTNVIHNDDGTTSVVQDNKGLFLYDNMIGFNADGRQAVFGTWANLGQPMLCRLMDTAADSGFLPKYGIVFDIDNSLYGNFAFAGKGAGVLNGMIDGFAFKKITLDKSNTVFGHYMDLTDANRFIVKASAQSTVLALPTIGQARTGLAVGSSGAFCARVTIMADIGSAAFSVCGRWSRKSSDGTCPWDTQDLPVMVHWNGDLYETFDMGAGDTLEVMLVYDPDNTDTLGNAWPARYTARIVNKLS